VGRQHNRSGQPGIGGIRRLPDEDHAPGESELLVLALPWSRTAVRDLDRHSALRLSERAKGAMAAQMPAPAPAPDDYRALVVGVRDGGQRAVSCAAVAIDPDLGGDELGVAVARDQE